MDKSRFNKCKCRHHERDGCSSKRQKCCKKPQCETGPPGPQGEAGPPGPQGETFGAKIICVRYSGCSGNSVPRDSTNYTEGDLFLDTSDADLFELRHQNNELHWVKHKDDTTDYHFYNPTEKTMWYVSPVGSGEDTEHGEALRIEEHCELLNINSQLLDIGSNVLYSPEEEVDGVGLLWNPEQCLTKDHCSCVKIICIEFEGRSGDSTPVSVLPDDHYYLNHGTQNAHDANLYVVNDGSVFEIDPSGAVGDYYYYSKNEKTIWFVEPITDTSSLDEGFVTRVEVKCNLKEGDTIIDGKTGRVFNLNSEGEWIESECGLCQCRECFRIIKIDCSGTTCDDIRECEISEAGLFVLSGDLIYTSALVGETLQWVLDTNDCAYFHDTDNGQIYKIDQTTGVATNIMLDDIIRGSEGCHDIIFDCEAKTFYQWNGAETGWTQVCDFSSLNITLVEGETGCFNITITDRINPKTLDILTLGADTKTEGNFLVSTDVMTQVPPNAPGTFSFHYQDSALNSMSFRSGTVTGTEWDDTLIGSNSAAFGFNTIADGSNTFAQGSGTISRGVHSHAEGEETEANGYATHTSGRGTKAFGSYTKATGSFNLFGATNGDLGALLVVGDGSSDLNRSDAMWVNNTGDAFVKNNFYGGYLGFALSRFFSGTGSHDLTVGDSRTSYITPYDLYLEVLTVTNTFALNFTLRISYTDEDNIPRTFTRVIAGALTSCIDVGVYCRKGSFLGGTVDVTTDPVVDASIAVYIAARVTREDLFREYKLP